MLPNVKINFDNGALGGIAPMDDAVTGLVCAAHEVSDGTEFGRTLSFWNRYLLTSVQDLAGLGVTSALNDPNELLYKTVREFYLEAPAGTKLWLFAIPHGKFADQELSVASDLINKFLVEAGGSIRTLMVASVNLWNDLDNYMSYAQSIADHSTDELYAPLMVILPYQGYTGNLADLANIGNCAYNRVCMMVGDSTSDSITAAVGLLAGRIASIPVHRSVARVKTGPLPVSDLFLGYKEPDSTYAGAVDDYGYITFRSFVGKGGYYFTDDKLATSAADDYSTIARRRTIDKAYRIAYQTLLNYVNDEIAVTGSGAISAPIAKSIQSAVETAIENGMAGSLGVDPADPKDTGVQCYIDASQNIVSTGKLNVSLRIKPFGYAKYIEVSLGFKTTTTTTT